MKRTRENKNPENFRFVGALRKKLKISAKVLQSYFVWDNPQRTPVEALKVIKTCAKNYATNWSKFETRGHPTMFSSIFESTVCETVNNKMSEYITNNLDQSWSYPLIIAMLKDVMEASQHYSLSAKFYSKFLQRHPFDHNGLLSVESANNWKLKPFTPELKLNDLGKAMLSDEIVKGVQCEDDGENDGIVDFVKVVKTFVAHQQVDVVFDENRFNSQQLGTLLLAECSSQLLCSDVTLQPELIYVEPPSHDDDPEGEAELLLSFGHNPSDDLQLDESGVWDIDSDIEPQSVVSWLNSVCLQLPVLIYQRLDDSNNDGKLTYIEANSRTNTFISATLHTVMMNVYFRSMFLNGCGNNKQFISPLTLRYSVLLSVMFDTTTEAVLEYIQTGNLDYNLVYSSPLSKDDYCDVLVDYLSDCVRSIPEQRNFMEVGRAATARLMNIGFKCVFLLFVVLIVFLFAGIDIRDLRTGKIERLNDVPDVPRFEIICDTDGVYHGTIAPRDYSTVVNYSLEEIQQFRNIRYIFQPIDLLNVDSLCATYVHNRPERNENSTIRAKALEIKKGMSKVHRPTRGGLAFPQDVFNTNQEDAYCYV
jgi:hypothetical protein